MRITLSVEAARPIPGISPSEPKDWQLERTAQNVRNHLAICGFSDATIRVSYEEQGD